MLERLPRSLAVLGLAAAFALPSVAFSHVHHAAARTRVAAHGSAARAARSVNAGFRRGSRSHHLERVAFVRHEAPPAMDTARATEIQSALIRAGYLSGEPTGIWDSGSVAAMQELQDDNGWQTKYTPDSRALVKLGLGGSTLPASQPTSTVPATTLAEAAQPLAPAQP